MNWSDGTAFQTSLFCNRTSAATQFYEPGLTEQDLVVRGQAAGTLNLVIKMAWLAKALGQAWGLAASGLVSLPTTSDELPIPLSGRIEGRTCNPSQIPLSSDKPISRCDTRVQSL